MTWNNNKTTVQTQTFTSLTDSLHNCSSLHSLSSDSIIPHLHTFLPHFCPFLFIAGWWLSSSYKWFLQRGKVIIFMSIIRNILFLWLENLWTFGILNQILQAAGTKKFQPHKNRTVPGKLGQMGSLDITQKKKTPNCVLKIFSLCDQD